MSYWNPQNKTILYFHVVRTDDDFYLKVDVIKQRVFKLCYKPIRIYGKHFKLGVFELKWSTFCTGHTWDLKPENIEYKNKLKARDGHERTKIKHTTHRQWRDHLKILMKEII